MRSIRFLATFSALALMLVPSVRVAAQVAAPAQDLWEHSTVATEDGSIRDDELMDFLCDKLKTHGLSNVKEVKFMTDACYGGGLLDDLERVFGPGGACEGVAWVGGAASSPDEPSWGWSDSYVNKEAKNGKRLSNGWTDALSGADRRPDDATDGSIRRGSAADKVIDDFNEAGNNDELGPNHRKKENPVVAAGNGGENAVWHGAGDKHEAVVFGGNQTNKRHHNVIENVKEALETVWPEGSRNINTIDGGKTQDLKDAIESAIGRLDSDTQLVLFIDDHGNTHFDIDEFLTEIYDEMFPVRITAVDGFGTSIMLHEGWPLGLAATELQSGGDARPTLDLELAEPVLADAWHVQVGGYITPFPPGELSGRIEIPVPWQALTQSEIFVGLFSEQPSAPDLLISEIELSSGHINNVEPLPEGTINRSRFEFGEQFIK